MGALNPSMKGGLLALSAALLFGLSTPLVQRFGQDVGPFTTAALLYAGAAFVAWWSRQPASREAQLQRGDAQRLLAMALMGAVVGPVALAWGLQRTSGSSASLMLTLEAVFTALLAWRWYGEVMDRRVTAAMLLLLLGGLVLIADQWAVGQVQLWGLLAVMLATAAWGLDNTLSRAVAERDPGQVILAKSVLGVLATGLLAWFKQEPWPTSTPFLALLAIGGSGYGLSLRFYLLAQRTFGAGRTGSVFAFAPFMGAVGAFALGERALSLGLMFGAVFMMLGVILHLWERHEHEHQHEALAHEHAHRHDDGHHNHSHEVMPDEAHSHWHVHEAMSHAHAHTPDIHHLHKH